MGARLPLHPKSTQGGGRTKDGDLSMCAWLFLFLSVCLCNFCCRSHTHTHTHIHTHTHTHTHTHSLSLSLSLSLALGDTCVYKSRVRLRSPAKYSASNLSHSNADETRATTVRVYVCSFPPPTHTCALAFTIAAQRTARHRESMWRWKESCTVQEHMCSSARHNHLWQGGGAAQRQTERYTDTW